MENFKLYIPTSKENTKIKFCISYTKESSSWATNESFEPGYRVNAKPVEVTLRDGYQWESSGAFTGFNDTLIPCSRRSNKRYESAREELNNRMEKYLKYFTDKGIVIDVDLILKSL